MIRCIKAMFALVVLVVCPSALHAEPAVDIAFIEVRAGGDSFVMGDGMLGPRVTRSVSYNFTMSRFTITNAQYGLFMAEGGYGEQSFWTVNGWRWKGRVEKPMNWKEPGFNGPSQPVIGVSWYEAVAFCNWLSSREGLAHAYGGSGRVDLSANGYRLPTELEWEYAAAKGAPDQAERIFPWGDAWDAQRAVCSVAPARASSTAAVGSRSPQGDTPQGLSDMSGNVWQWCNDNAQADDAIARSAAVDRYFYRSDSVNEFMMLRGASWCNDFQRGYRVSYRGYTAHPDSRNTVTGFRVVRRVQTAAAALMRQRSGS